MTTEEMDFIGSMNMCDEISNEAYQKIMTHCEEQEPCEDCVSRESMMVRVKEYFDNPSYDEKMLYDDLVNLPSVTPQPFTLEKAIDYLHEIGWMQEHDKEMAQPKMGEWLKNGDFCKCSNCHTNVLHSVIKHYKYCPSCGSYNGGE